MHSSLFVMHWWAVNKIENFLIFKNLLAQNLPLRRVSASSCRLWILERVWVWKTAFLLLIRLNLLLKVIISFKNFPLSSQYSLFSLSWILKQSKGYYADYKQSTKALLTLQHEHCIRWWIMHGYEIFNGEWRLFYQSTWW